jgi:hypothetical protein
MKTKRFFLFGLPVVLLALGLVFAGCDTGGNEPYDGPKSFKVTGINKAAIKATALVQIISNDNSFPANGQAAEGPGEIVSQTLSVDLHPWTSDGGPSDQSWTGTGEWTIRLKLFDNDNSHYYDYFWKNGQKYAIEDAVTSLNFADFNLVHTGEQT